MIKKISGLMAVLTFTACAGMANAGLIQYSDTNAGGELWSGAYPADLQPFYVSTSGTYSMETISGNFDTYLFLYSGIPSIPSSNFGNAITYNDDGGSGLLSLISNISLVENIQYSLLTRGFGGATGNFTAQISGVGDITLGEVEFSSQIPEPASLALLGLGLAGLGFSRRKKA
jgi:hypothetical protein